MSPPSKKQYQKHQYTQSKSKGKSAAAFKRHRGEDSLSRWKAWGLKENEGIKTYGRGNPEVRFEATFDEPKQNNRTTDHFTTPEFEWPSVDIHDHTFTVELTEKKNGLPGLSGNRIVDINHVLNWALDLKTDHSKVCTGGVVEFVKETRIGFYSNYKFTCSFCNRIWTFGSHPEQDKINTAFVWGTLTAASFYSQSSHVVALMNIPGMGTSMFRRIEEKLGKTWEDILLDELKSAGEEEKSIALSKGHICQDGVPFITVYVDGGWSKRSYGHNFNANSGAACIIGKETKKCLFVGVRNKFCYCCQYYANRNETAKQHVCYKNYEGSSTAMEADILVSGFNHSEEMHGLRFLHFIGDGDSSVFARLKEKVSYGHSIKKMECKNHAVKNYTSALYKILNNTKLPLADRKLLKSRLSKLTMVARKSINHNIGNVVEMHKDIANSPFHVYGQHINCKSYYCKYIDSNESEINIEPDTNVVPAVGVVVWTMIINAAENLARKSERLINSETNNIAENFMALLAKFNCGKRLNLTNKGSFQRRAQLAGINQVRGSAWHLDGWRKFTQSSPGLAFKKFIQRKEQSHQRRSKCIKRKLFKRVVNADKDYGPEADDLPADISTDQLELLCQEKLKSLQLSESDVMQVEYQSREQHGNEIYDSYRKDRLTASQFGMICKRRISTACHNHVKSVLYATDFTTKDLNYGRDNESVAIAIFEKEFDKTVRKSGLYIDTVYGFLGASPDGVIDNERAVVEVKCFPSLVRKGCNIETAAKENKNFPFIWNGDQLAFNKKHSYYFQIQGQLYCSKLDYAYLIGYLEADKPITVMQIPKDEVFIQNMVEKLVWFYVNCIAPELVLRRVPLKQKCIDPKEILESQTSKKAKPAD